MTKKDRIINRRIRNLYNNIVRNLIIFCIFVFIVSFINHNFINRNKSENGNEYTLFSMADIKDYILNDYRDSETVYYKFINTDNNKLNIIVWDENDDTAQVYRFAEVSENKLQFEMVFESQEIALDQLRYEYDGVMK